MGEKRKRIGPGIVRGLGKRGMAMGKVRQAVITVILMLFVFLIIPAVYAEEVVKPFTFKTLGGRILDFNWKSGGPLVINVGSHG